jgi:hypothetical protein
MADDTYDGLDLITEIGSPSEPLVAKLRDLLDRHYTTEVILALAEALTELDDAKGAKMVSKFAFAFAEHEAATA